MIFSICTVIEKIKTPVGEVETVLMEVEGVESHNSMYNALLMFDAATPIFVHYPTDKELLMQTVWENTPAWERL